MAKILIACEESQVVCHEFRNLGHEAYSCDLLPCSGGCPEWHLQQDVLGLLDEDWDLIIAFPECTHLAVSGARHFAVKRADGRQQRGIDFFMRFANAKCSRIAIENPIGIMSSVYKKPSQVIQPWMFGHKECKATCLWLKNLPNLIPTDIVGPPPKNKEERKSWERIHRMPPGPERAKMRSKTYLGIGKAMAMQWSLLLG